jgi:hypothetical protein
MKLLSLYLFTMLFSQVSTSLTPTKKICRDCRHFIGNDIECRKFGETNLVTGKITYEYARSAREDNKKCGEDAVLFEKNHFKIITVPYYYFKDNLLFLLSTGLLTVYIFAVIITSHK